MGVVCFNAGSIATMCGNALRCVAWCAAKDHSLQEMTLVMAGAVSLRHVEAAWNGRPLWFDSAHTGTEHVVAIVEDVDGIDVEECGRLVRDHAGLAPLGSNVNFVEITGAQELGLGTGGASPSRSTSGTPLAIVHPEHPASLAIRRFAETRLTPHHN